METSQRAAAHRDALCKEPRVGLRGRAGSVAIALAVGYLQLTLARQEPTPALRVARQSLPHSTCSLGLARRAFKGHVTETCTSRRTDVRYVMHVSHMHVAHAWYSGRPRCTLTRRRSNMQRAGTRR